MNLKCKETHYTLQITTFYNISLIIFWEIMALEVLLLAFLVVSKASYWQENFETNGRYFRNQWHVVLRAGYTPSLRIDLKVL